MTPYFFGMPEDKKRALNGRCITKYRCYAVVQHHGKTVNEGHYTALVRERPQDGPIRTVQQRTKEGKWWRFDDQKVTMRHESETQKASSYLLFYEKIENARD